MAHKQHPEDEIERITKEALAGFNPRLRVYQWFGLSLTGSSTDTQVSVEVETQSYCKSRPAFKSFPDRESWKAALNKFKQEQQGIALDIISAAAKHLVNLGFYMQTWNDYGWPKLTITKTPKSLTASAAEKR